MTIIEIILALGGATLVKQVLAIFTEVTGIYAWVIAAAMFCLFFLSLEFGAQRLGSKEASALANTAPELQQIPDPQPISEPEPEPKPRPRLELVGFKAASIGYGSASWEELKFGGSPNSCIAIFENPPAEPGKEVKAIGDATARLTYRNNRGKEEHINFGTWVGEYTHYMDFKPGERMAVVLSVRPNAQDPVCALFNPYQSDPRVGRYTAGATLYAPQEIPIIDDCSIIEILLISRNFTLYREEFACRIASDGTMQLLSKITTSAPLPKGDVTTRVKDSAVVGPMLHLTHGQVNVAIGDRGSFGWAVLVRNVQDKIDTTAHNVTVTLLFKHHVTGEQRKATGIWMSQKDNKWSHRLSLKMDGDAECAPLFYWDASANDREYILCDAESMNINAYGLLLNVNPGQPLQKGRWDIALKLTGDNLSDENWSMIATLGPRRLDCTHPVKQPSTA